MCPVQANSEEIEISYEMLRSRLKREQRARKAAEALIEQKSQELFDANQAQSQLLSGSIKLLTQVLSVARPELFEKSAKVQRWSRRIAANMKIEKPHELDLATVLYPIGVISLTDELAERCVSGQKLTDAEHILFEESQKAGYKMIDNIPYMGGVATTIYYSRKGYDGSDFPNDSVAGTQIPQAARILRVLIDLADAATGTGKNRTDAFMTLAGQKHKYDPEVLKVAYMTLLEQQAKEEEKEEVLTLEPMLLHSGDIVRKDITDVNDKLLLAAGSELTDLSIKRLVAFRLEKRFDQPVHVVRPTK